jgi:hypothetical protein
MEVLPNSRRACHLIHNRRKPLIVDERMNSEFNLGLTRSPYDEWADILYPSRDGNVSNWSP